GVARPPATGPISDSGEQWRRLRRPGAGQGDSSMGTIARTFAASAAAVFFVCRAVPASRSGPGALPGPEAVIASELDLWGDAAIRHPGGPTYAFFADLLPPLRYVDADFRHYPIVLSAPGSPSNARLVSNGIAINALERQPNWKNEAGIPVHVRVGEDRDPFGSDPTNLDGPRYAEGYLPIVQLRYRHDGLSYGQEAFAAVDETLAAAGTAVV